MEADQLAALEARKKADREVNRRTVKWCLVCDRPDCSNWNHDQLGGVWFCDLCKRREPCAECRGRNG